MSNNTPDITLTISSDNPAPSGYTPSGTLNYSYKFTGGNDGAGGITGKDNDGAVNVDLTLASASTVTMYINSVSFFTVDANGNKTPYTGDELGWNPDNQEPVTSGKINDKMDNVQDYYYSVLVSVPFVADFTCDPPIKNVTT
jgi:hypothetical protein